MNKFTLDKKLQTKWLNNILVFLAPVIALYLTTVIGVISQDNHVFKLLDFIPNAFARGGIVLWFLNVGLDYIRKLRVQ